MKFYYQTNMQDPATDIAIDLIRLNRTITFYLILILSFVAWIAFVKILLSSVSARTIYIVNSMKKDLMHFIRVKEATKLELIWTIVPAVILVLLAIPSFTLLYQAEEKHTDYESVSVVGHQWYWEYVYSLKGYIQEYLTLWANENSRIQLEFSSGFKQVLALITEETAPRLLGTNTRLVLPSFVPVKLWITSEDVIHSFAIPMAGVKIDAIPGRINTVNTIIEREAVLSGSCYELCGVNHSYMPILGVGITKDLYNIITLN